MIFPRFLYKGLDSCQSRRNRKFTATVCANIVIAAVTVCHSNNAYIFKVALTGCILTNLVCFNMVIALYRMSELVIFSHNLTSHRESAFTSCPNPDPVKHQWHQSHHQKQGCSEKHPA